MPSASLNAQFKTQLNDYHSKAQIAMQTDKTVEDKFAVHGDSLKLLNKTKNELSALIPQSQDTKVISQNPAVVAIKQSLDTFDQLKDQRQKILEEGVQKCQNHNAVEDLMLVNANQAAKGTVFDKHVAEFRSIYTEIETIEKRRAETQGVVTANMGGFGALVSASQQDTAK